MKKEIEIAINGNYTRGPWEVEYGQLHPSSEKEAYTIRTDAFDVVSGHLLIRREADALLIAAAPDLADALRESQAREKRLRDQNADLLSQLDAMQFMHNVQVVRQKRLREALEAISERDTTTIDSRNWTQAIARAALAETEADNIMQPETVGRVKAKVGTVTKMEPLETEQSDGST
jgi:hypothetical protein